MSRELPPEPEGEDPARASREAHFYQFTEEVNDAFVRVRMEGAADDALITVRLLPADPEVGRWVQQVSRMGTTLRYGEELTTLGVDDVIADALFAGAVGLEVRKHALDMGVHEVDSRAGFSATFDEISYDGGDTSTFHFMGVHVPADIAREVRRYVRDGVVHDEGEILAAGARIISRVSEYPGAKLIAGFTDSTDVAIADDLGITEERVSFQQLPLMGEYFYDIPRLE
ncbi:MAG TPA: hypothetical protein VJP80_03220 [Candidatus Saccharimonadales bacterium]|nr:hypothetical protein [Candidatus Saccharimonadales bacterium]